jgi:citrate/tricarballylate utilization protein
MRRLVLDAKLPVLDAKLTGEALRQFEICNACRYCEGVCAVFPALETLKEFGEREVLYLANLCHDCRACLYVCPYGPPHEFNVNIPKVMSEVRTKTYAAYSWPQQLGALFRGKIRVVSALTISFVGLAVAVSIIVAGVEGLFAPHAGPGSLYEVFPWIAMVLSAGLLSLFALAVILRGAVLFWGEIKPSRAPVVEGVAEATWDAAILRFMAGGGRDCNYPDERPSNTRRLLHSLVFGGFLLAFASTVSAAVYQDIIGILPPYPVLSIPVVLGTVGGTAMIGGSIGLLWQKHRSDPEPATERMQQIDIRFTVMLLLVNVSGMLLLVVRETPLMGLTLDIHLGLLAGLFLTMPYGKFVHFVYRYLALIRYRTEHRQDTNEEAPDRLT